MLSPETIDLSAAGLAATHLNPERLRAIDRTIFAPLAVLAVWNLPYGTVALEHQKGTRGVTFPISAFELPVMRGDNPDVIAKETAEFLSEITDRLQISRHVQRISGLKRPNSDGGFIAPRGNTYDDRRIIAVPFMAIITGKPSIRRAPWYNPIEARRHFVGQHRGLSAKAKRVILDLSERRFAEERRSPYLQNLPKPAYSSI